MRPFLKGGEKEEGGRQRDLYIFRWKAVVRVREVSRRKRAKEEEGRAKMKYLVACGWRGRRRRRERRPPKDGEE